MPPCYLQVFQPLVIPSAEINGRSGEFSQKNALFGYSYTCKLPLGSWIDSTAILQQISMELRSGLPGPI